MAISTALGMVIIIYLYCSPVEKELLTVFTRDQQLQKAGYWERAAPLAQILTTKCH